MGTGRERRIVERLYEVVISGFESIEIYGILSGNCLIVRCSRFNPNNSLGGDYSRDDCNAIAAWENPLLERCAVAAAGLDQRTSEID